MDFKYTDETVEQEVSREARRDSYLLGTFADHVTRLGWDGALNTWLVYNGVPSGTQEAMARLLGEMGITLTTPPYGNDRFPGHVTSFWTDLHTNRSPAEACKRAAETALTPETKAFYYKRYNALRTWSIEIQLTYFPCINPKLTWYKSQLGY